MESPLQSRAFRAIWIASIFSYAGSWVQDVGASWLMVTMNASPFLVAMLTTSFTVPFMILALPSGLLADRADRRMILVWSQLAQAAFAMLLAIVTWLHRVSPGVLLVESALLGIASSATSPPWHSLVPELAGKRHLTEAVTLNSIAFNIARATGPAIGGFLLGLWGPGWAFAINALSFLCVVWALLHYDEVKRASELPRNTPTKNEPSPGGGYRPLPVDTPILRGLIAPIPFLRDSARLRAIFMAMSVFAFSAATVPSMLPILAKRSLHATATGYGFMLCAMGLGAVLSGIVLRRIRKSMGPRALVPAAMLAFGAAVLALAFASALWMAVALLVPTGMGWLACLSTCNAQAQLASPAWLKSRVMSLYNLVFFLVWSLGATFGGALASRYGERSALLFAGLATFVAAAVARRAGLLDREIEPDSGSIPPPAVIEGKRAA